MRIDLYNRLCKQAQAEFVKLALPAVPPFAGAKTFAASAGSLVKAAPTAVAGSVGKVLPPVAQAAAPAAAAASRAPTPYKPLFQWPKAPATTTPPVAMPGSTVAGSVKPPQQLPKINQGSLDLTPAQMRQTPTYHLLNRASPQEFMRTMKASAETGAAPGITHSLLNMHDSALAAKAEAAAEVRRAAQRAAMDKTVAPPVRGRVLPPSN